MKMNLKQPFGAIKALDACELPDFAVLIGRNGVGKTQLFTGLAERRITGPAHPAEVIEKYDIASFRPGPAQRASLGGSLFAERTGEKFHDGTGGTAPVDLAKEIYRRTVDEYGLGDGTALLREFDALVQKAIDIPDFEVFGTMPVEGPRQGVAGAVTTYTREIAKGVIGPLGNQGARRKKREDSCNNNPAILLSMAMKLARKLPHEVDRTDILRAAHYEGATIGNALSEAFTRYKGEQYSWAVTESERGRGDVKGLVAKYRKENTPPWQTVRDVLEAMRESAGGEDVFHFEFTDPEDARINHADHQQFSFETALTNRTTGDSYDLQQLSSGEGILMALCMVWFNQAMGRRRPKLLLLDELDAMLHPSMVGALVSCLKDLFVKNGTKVLMATHCPATVAVLEDGEIFRVTRDGGTVRIRPVSRSEAVEDLSEGIATLDTGLRIATSSAALVTIVTEGHNAMHLKRWAGIHFPRDVHVFDQLPDRTGASDLRAYARILGKMTPDSHLLFVWDCDQAAKTKGLLGELEEDGKVTAFVLEQRDNPLAPGGIENKYGEVVLAPYLADTRDRMTGELLRSGFNGRKKRQFAEHMRQHGTKEDFRHFDDLYAVVAEVLAQATGNEGDKGTCDERGK